MSTRRMAGPVMRVLCAGLAGCASAPRAVVLLDAQVPPLSAAEFPGSEQLLGGIDPPGGDATWRVGDAVLYGLRLQQGRQIRRWLLRVEVEQPEARGADGSPAPPIVWPILVNGELVEFRSRLCRVRVTVADGLCNVLGTSAPVVPRDFLQHGFAPACRAVQDVLASRPHLRNHHLFYAQLEERELAESVVCALALLQVVQGDEVLSPLLAEVVQRPSLWSLVENLGASVVVQPRFHLTEPALPPAALGSAGAAWRTPMRVLVNDAPGLEAELLVAGTAEPFALCGGILGAVARHPSEPSREFSMLLLAARRGPRP